MICLKVKGEFFAKFEEPRKSKIDAVSYNDFLTNQ